MRLSRQILLMLALASLGALLQGLLQGRPAPADEADEWALTIEEAIGLEDSLWVDSRSGNNIQDARYPGAYTLNEENWDTRLGLFLEAWDGNQAVVVYCEGDGCASSRKLAQRLREELGIERVYWLIDGWEAIEQAGVLP